jgi:hypothetical protein
MREAVLSRGCVGVMDSEEYYLKQAEICRDQATLRFGDPETRAIWLKLAQEYEKLAEQAVVLAMPPAAVRRAPMPQSRKKTTGEDGR